MEIRSLESAEAFVTADGSTIREARATLEPGQATERHYHSESEEI